MTEKIDAKKLAERYMTAVQDQLGLLAKKDDSDDVVFKHPDLGTFYFSLDAPHDPEYFMLVFPNFMSKDSTGGDRLKLLEAVNKVNRRAKGAKLCMRDGDDGPAVTASIECFVAGPDEAPSQEFLNAIIKRTMSSIRACVAELVKEVESAEAEKESSSAAAPNTSSI
jgi:hypothetical protein